MIHWSNINAGPVDLTGQDEPRWTVGTGKPVDLAAIADVSPWSVIGERPANLRGS